MGDPPQMGGVCANPQPPFHPIPWLLKKPEAVPQQAYPECKSLQQLPLGRGWEAGWHPEAPDCICKTQLSTSSPVRPELTMRMGPSTHPTVSLGFRPTQHCPAPPRQHVHVQTRAHTHTLRLVPEHQAALSCF